MSRSSRLPLPEDRDKQTGEEKNVLERCIFQALTLSSISSVLFHRLLNNFLNNAQGAGQLISKVKRYQSLISLFSTVVVFLQVNRQYNIRVCRPRLLSLPPSPFQDIMIRRWGGNEVGRNSIKLPNRTGQTDALKEYSPDGGVSEGKGDLKYPYVNHDEKEEANYTRDKQAKFTVSHDEKEEANKQAKYTYVQKKEHSEMYKPLNKYGDVVEDAYNEGPRKQESNVTDGRIKRNKYGDIIDD